MRIVRVVERDQVHLGMVDVDEQVYKLNSEPDGPADYLSLYRRARDAGRTVSEFAEGLADAGTKLPWSVSDLDIAADPKRPYLSAPFSVPEAWGAAFSYSRPDRGDRYAEERRAERPVIFFKATAHRSVGPNEAIGSRADTTAMIPEPELGLVLDPSGDVIGYTIANDVSSRDLPRENPLFVCYSKTFTRCLSFGPAVVPPEAIGDATDLEVSCRVMREGSIIWEDTGTTKNMTRSFKELVQHLIAHNEVPLGTLLATGTALSPPSDMHLREGDFVEVEIERIGRLANPVVVV